MSKTPDLRPILSRVVQEDGTEGAMVVNYHLVVEVVSPNAKDPWLRVLGTPGGTPWAQVGLAHAGLQLSEAYMGAGWSSENDSD